MCGNLAILLLDSSYVTNNPFQLTFTSFEIFTPVIVSNILLLEIPLNIFLASKYSLSIRFPVSSYNDEISMVHVLKCNVLILFIIGESAFSSILLNCVTKSLTSISLTLLPNV